MCGIAGIINPDNSIPIREQLQKMMNILEHRGPDAQGMYVEGHLGLAHRRLSIIDLAAGSQPMSNRQKTVWISFNGEIYNFHAIREKLKKKGYIFTTNSDTEVIIQAYEEYGEDCVKQFRGMFAFAIWDSIKKKLFMARDRLGKKPFYYFWNGKRLVFASEIKAILQTANISKELDFTALKDYFTYLYIPFPRTIFKQIFKLPPAHTMSFQLFSDKLSEFRLSIKPYWDITYTPDDSLSENEWMEKLEAKLYEAVKIRMISDVPIGAFLSGGIDSSTVVAIMSQVMEQPVKTYSIGFEESDFNELKYAAKIAEKYETDHHEIIVKPDAIQTLQKLAWQFDEPFADSSAIPTYYVSKAAREHVTVILSGDGGDEAFAGYERYNNYFNLKRFDVIPLWLRKAIFGKTSELMPRGMKGKGILRHLSRSSFHRYAGMVTHIFPGYLENFFHKDIKRELNSCNEDFDFFKKFYNTDPELDDLSRLQYLDTKTYLAEDILTKVDRTSMLCSLETRAPLLDHKLIEFLATMPADLLLRNGEKKYILKKTMEKHLPRQILYRKKMGFDIPTTWFKKDFYDYSRDILLSESFKSRNFFNTKYVENLMNSSKKRGRNLGAQIWTLLFFEQWCRNWLN